MKCLCRLLELLICRDLARFEGKLDQILNHVKEHTMKLSEIKSQIAEAAKNSREAFSELSTRITDLQTKVDKLQADLADPEVTDEAFAANLQSVSDDVRKLAELTPNPEPPEEPVSEPTV